MEKSSSQPIQGFNAMDRIQTILILFRPHQYYKNFLVFFGLFFSENLFRLELWIPVILAFISLCLVSSLNYILNDFRDREKDKFHPEKSHRPFPSGKISTSFAAVLMIVLIIIVVFIVILIPTSSEAIDPQQAIVNIPSKTAFFLVLIGLFVTSQLYSLFLKQIVFADIVTISVNYVWRAIAGAVLISVSVSPWLIILCFVTAMMLSLAKRKGDLSILGTNAIKHKKVFESYTIELLDQSLATITAIEIIAIFIYLIERHPNETVFIVVSLPVITFGIFRFLYLVSMNSVEGRKAEKLFFDKQILIAGAMIVFLFFIAIYYPNLLDNFIGIPDPNLV